MTPLLATGNQYFIQDQVKISLITHIRTKSPRTSNLISSQPTTHFTVAYSMSREVGTSTSRDGQTSPGTYGASDAFSNSINISKSVRHLYSITRRLLRIMLICDYFTFQVELLDPISLVRFDPATLSRL